MQCVWSNVKGVEIFTLYKLIHIPFSGERRSKGERYRIVKPRDNLRMEGHFRSKSPDNWKPGQRANVVKHSDNLKSDGEFTKRVVESWIVGDKHNMVKRSDNLQLEGKFETKPTRKLNLAKVNGLVSRIPKGFV